MAGLIDLVGKTFGLLVVLRLHAEKSGKKRMWSCMCKCGKQVVVRGDSLRRGNTKSCGCLHINYLRKRTIAKGTPAQQEKYFEAVDAAPETYEWDD